MGIVSSVQDNIVRYSNPGIHERIVMPNFELPINFIEHHHGSEGPFCILHWHPELEMVYVLEGRLVSNINARPVESQPGDFIFVNSNEPHDYVILEAPVTLYCCTIDTSLLQGRYQSSFDSRFISQAQGITIFQNLVRDDDPVRQSFLAMWEEGQRKEPGYEYAIKANLYAILSRMVRRHTHSTMTNKQYLYKHKNLESVNRVIHYIEENFQEDISLDELAALLNINRYYFCRFFKNVIGSTPMEYINQYRVHQAIALMNEHPSRSITEIATSVGYNDSNYFGRVFKSITNESPTVYRANLGETVAAELRAL